jgi:glycosyltransferase involved in cell wall biosynthesis
LRDYADPRIKIISQENKGVSEARNRGVREAAFAWIAFIDADDSWSKFHLEELDALIQSFPSAGLASTRSIEIKLGAVLPAMSKRNNWKRSLIDYFLEASDREGVVHSSAAAVRRDVFEKIGYFLNFKRGEDTEFWSRVCLSYPCAFSERPTSFYHRGTGGIMEQLWALKAAVPEEINRLEDISPAVSMLAERLAIGFVCQDRIASVRAFINSRVTIALRVALYNGNVKSMKGVAALYMPPLLKKPYFWKVLTVFPVWVLWVIYKCRTLARALYRYIK